MESRELDIYQTFRYLPEPFKEYNEIQGKKIYEELLYRPLFEDEPDKYKKHPKYFTSILISHFANDTRELISFIDDNKEFLTKGGHMNREDHKLIIEILYEHTFTKEIVHHSAQFQLFSLMMDLLNINYEKLSLSLDWRPIYNSMFAISSKRKLHAVMLTFSDNHGNIYNKLENLCYKLK